MKRALFTGVGLVLAVIFIGTVIIYGSYLTLKKKLDFVS
jgi:hypothetical protein